MNAFDLFVDKYASISEEAYKEFTGIFIRKNFFKNQVITKQGEIHYKCYLLEEGVACNITFDDKGKQNTRTIFTSASIVASLPSLIDKTPSKSEYVCLTDCTILEADYSDIQRLIKKHHDLAILYSKFLERIFIRIEDRNKDLTILNSEQRYLKLKKMAPGIENKIPLYHIAAYLNITPIQLSRIRKKVYSK
jgi:CRP-like cAMP-binding protein